jgi:hypothetical protein
VADGSTSLFYVCFFIEARGGNERPRFAFVPNSSHSLPTLFIPFPNRFEARGNNMSHAETSAHCRAVGNLQLRGHAVYGVRIVSIENLKAFGAFFRGGNLERIAGFVNSRRRIGAQ